MIRLDEYNYIDCDKPFVNIVFKYDDDKIKFTIHEHDIDMEIDGNVPMEAVEEAINIVKSRKLEF